VRWDGRFGRSWRWGGSARSHQRPPATSTPPASYRGMKQLAHVSPRPLAAIIAAVLLVGLVASLASGGGVFSLFNATKSASTTAGSGTVALDLSSAAGASFSATVADLAPGDQIQREVTLTNTGSVGVGVADLGITESGCAVAGTATSCASTPLVAGDTASPGLLVFGATCPGGTINATEIGTSGEYSFACSTSWNTVLGAAPVVTTPTASTATPNPAPILTPPSSSVSEGLLDATSSTLADLSSSASAPNYTALTLATVTNSEGVPEVLPPGGSATFVLTAYLPSSADNAFQNNSATLTFDFQVVQRAGEAK